MISPDGPVIPPTPPPDIDLQAWHRSLELIAAWRPTRLAMTHFGSGERVDQQLAELSRRLDLWAEIALREDLQGFADAVTAELRENSPPETIDAYLQAAPIDQLYAGLRRYWYKQGALEAS